MALLRRSPRQIAANRANARLSRGPVTPAGKRKSSQNACKLSPPAKFAIEAVERAQTQSAAIQDPTEQSLVLNFWLFQAEFDYFDHLWNSAWQTALDSTAGDPGEALHWLARESGCLRHLLRRHTAAASRLRRVACEIARLRARRNEKNAGSNPYLVETKPLHLSPAALSVVSLRENPPETNPYLDTDTDPATNEAPRPHSSANSAASSSQSAPREPFPAAPRTPPCTLSSMNLQGKKVAVFVDQQYQEMEVWYPYYRLLEAGAEVHLVAAEAGKTYPSKTGYPCTSDKAFSDIKPADYDGVVAPGGFAPDFIRRQPASSEFIAQMNHQGKLVAAICHGLWCFCSAGILRGRRCTSFFAIKDDVVNAGGLWEDSEVVVDINMVSSRKPADLPAFMRACIHILAKQAK